MARFSAIEINVKKEVKQFERLFLGFSHSLEMAAASSMRSTVRRGIMIARQRAAARLGIKQKPLRTRMLWYMAYKRHLFGRMWLGQKYFLRPREHPSIEAIAKAKGYRRITTRYGFDYVRSKPGGGREFFEINLQDEDVDRDVYNAAHEVWPSLFNLNMEKQARQRLNRLHRKGLVALGSRSIDILIQSELRGLDRG